MKEFRGIRVLGHAASPWTTAGLCLALSAVYIGMSFGEAPYETFIEFIFASAPGLILFLSLIMNLTAWSLLAVFKRSRKEVLTPETVRSMDESVLLPADSGIRNIGQASEWFERMGFSPRPSGEGIESRKGRLGIVPGIVLRTGLGLLLLSALLSHHMREIDEALLVQGGEPGLATLLGREVVPLRIEAGFSEEFLDLGKESFELHDTSALVSVGGEEFTVTGGYPVKVAGLYWRIVHIGYMQPVTRMKTTLWLPLDVLPPGRASAHAMPNVFRDGRVYEFRLAPEKKVKKGLISGDVFNLAEPSYVLSPRGIRGGEVTIRSGSLPLSSMRMAEFGRPGYYVRLLAVGDPALSLLELGFYISSLGVLLMIVRLFWYERRMAAVMYEGRVLMGYSEEFYRKWGIYKFRKWTGHFFG